LGSKVPPRLCARFGLFRSAENGTGQQSLRRRAGGRRDGTASTTTQSARIADPMNSNTNTSTAIPQQTDRFVGEQLTVSYFWQRA
jgi:hypothetical protein